ncbi:hypothetical protein Droror1_Dr00002224 [Drosera rotundifolia]
MGFEFEFVVVLGKGEVAPRHCAVVSVQTCVRLSFDKGSRVPSLGDEAYGGLLGPGMEGYESGYSEF